MRFVRALFVLYWTVLTVLLVVPDPFGLFGIGWPRGAGARRGIHFVFFTALSILALASRFRAGRRVLAVALVSFAVVTEALHAWIPDRAMELLDLAENLLGLLTGAAVWVLWRRTVKTDSSQPPEKVSS